MSNCNQIIKLFTEMKENCNKRKKIPITGNRSPVCYNAESVL